MCCLLCPVLFIMSGLVILLLQNVNFCIIMLCSQTLHYISMYSTAVKKTELLVIITVFSVFIVH